MMAAANIIKNMFLLTVIFFGAKTLHFIKQTSENYSDIHLPASLDGGNLETFERRNSLGYDVYNKRNDGYYEMMRLDSDIDAHNEKIKGNLADLRNDSGKKSNVTGSAAVVKRLQKKRKLLSQLWDRYYKLRLNATNNLKNRNKFHQTGDDIFVYSAFYDDRHQNPVVRVLAISKLHSKAMLACRFPNTRVSKWVFANKTELSDNHNKPYGGVMYNCNIPNYMGNKPPKTVYLHSVFTHNNNFSKVTRALVSKEVMPLQMSIRTSTIYHRAYDREDFSSNDQKTSNNARDFLESSRNDTELKKIHTDNKSMGITAKYQGRQLNSTMVKMQEELLRTNKKITRISVCVSPLFGDVELSAFIQFVEIHKILGVNHLFFYKMNVSSDIERMLVYYESQGIVTLTDWSLPKILQDSANIWYNGQTTAQQDCLYKNIGNFDFTAFADIDEIIVPYSQSDWPQMLQNLQQTFDSNKKSTAAVFTFKSGFFESDAKIDETKKMKQSKLSFLRNIYRNEMISSVRSKVIVKPAYVEQIGVHHVSKLLNLEQKLETISVPTETALIHHYRKCTAALDSQMHCGNYVRDTSLLKYSDILVKNFDHALEDNIQYFRSIKSM